MEKLNKKAVAYIKKHMVFTLATCAENIPYCSTMTYAYMEEEHAFVFTSHKNTRHVAEVSANPVVAGNIVQDIRNFTRIQGLQFTGKMAQPQGDFLAKARKTYLKRYPLAVVADLDLWVVEMDFVKFTNNVMGVPSLIRWEKGKGNEDITPKE